MLLAIPVLLFQIPGECKNHLERSKAIYLASNDLPKKKEETSDDLTENLENKGNSISYRISEP